MSISHLLLENSIQGFKKNSRLIFFDEYSKRLLDEKVRKNFKVNFILKLNELKKFNLNSNILKKKSKKYRKELSIVLNKIHKKNYDENYWGLIIDRLLYLTINGIIFELDILKKIKKKNKKNIKIKKIIFNETFVDSDHFASSYETNLVQPYIRYCIAKSLGFGEIKTKIKSKNLEIKSTRSNSLNINESVSSLIRIFFRLYLRFFKPFLIVDGFIPRKNSVKLFFQSLGKILLIPSHLIFPKNYISKKKDNRLRKLIKIKEKDFIDKIFNLLFRNFIPLSNLENYGHFNNYIKNFKSLPAVGTAVSLIYNDYFKFMSAEILKKKGQVIVFQHGGLIGHLKYDHDVTINDRYSTKVFSWHKSKNFSDNYFKRFNKITFDEINNKKGILIFPTRIKIRYSYNQCVYKKNHPYLNCNYLFYGGLNKKIKSETFVKIFPNKISNLSLKIWKQKFNNDVNIIYKWDKKLFNKFRIVVIDDLSTPICELLYIGIPFIVINNELEWLKQNMVKKIKKLKKLNIWFDDPKDAYHFINKNYDKIPSWWKKNSQTTIFKNFKKELIPTKKEESILKLLKN